jgi:hypothetical protein
VEPDLTFATRLTLWWEANVKSEAPLKSIFCWWSFDSNIRKRARRNGVRMLESDHQSVALAGFHAAIALKTRQIGLAGPNNAF